eukprot:ANDGO_06784.mRNA.1 hypothetical protein
MSTWEEFGRKFKDASMLTLEDAEKNPSILEELFGVFPAAKHREPAPSSLSTRANERSEFEIDMSKMEVSLPSLKTSVPFVPGRMPLMLPATAQENEPFSNLVYPSVKVPLDTAYVPSIPLKSHTETLESFMSHIALNLVDDSAASKEAHQLDRPTVDRIVAQLSDFLDESQQEMQDCKEWLDPHVHTQSLRNLIFSNACRLVVQKRCVVSQRSWILMLNALTPEATAVSTVLSTYIASFDSVRYHFIPLKLRIPSLRLSTMLLRKDDPVSFSLQRQFALLLRL